MTSRRALGGVLAVSFVVFAVYQLTVVLLPFAAARTGYGTVGAGGLNATFMAGAVLGPLVARRLFALAGLRATVVWSIATLGASTFVVGLVHALWQLLAINGVRGVVFGIVAAALPVVVVHNVTPDGRGGALGVWGLVCTVPAVFAPGLAVVLADRTSLAATTAVAAAVTLVALAPLATASGRARWPGREGAAAGEVASGRHGARRFSGPVVVFLCAASAYGAVVSFMPLFLTGGRPAVSTSVAFLLAMGCALPLGRLLGGGGLARLALPLGVALSAAGLALVLTSTATPATLAAGGAYGLGFGLTTTASQLVLLVRAGQGGAELASVLFSVLFNAGIGLGGLGAGLLADGAGLRAAFWLCAGASALAVPLAIAVASGR